MTEIELTDPRLRRERHRLDVAKIVGIYLAAACALVTMVVVVVIVGQTGSVTGYISDCTTPSGNCYKQIQKTNAENRARLIDGDVATQWCARTSRSLDELQACVTRTLQQIGDK